MPSGPETAGREAPTDRDRAVRMAPLASRMPCWTALGISRPPRPKPGRSRGERVAGQIGKASAIGPGDVPEVAFTESIAPSAVGTVARLLVSGVLDRAHDEDGATRSSDDLI